MAKLMEALKARGGTAKKVEIDVSNIFGEDGGEKVFVRQPTMGDREWMLEAMTPHGTGADVSLLPTMEARCRQIVRLLVNEKGERLLTDIDVDGLMRECRDADVTDLGDKIDKAFPANVTVGDAAKN